MLTKSAKFTSKGHFHTFFRCLSSMIQKRVPDNGTEATEIVPVDPQNESHVKRSPLDKCTEDLSEIAPYFMPTFNFAAYINKSETLQELLKLGVNLYKLEKKVIAVPLILKLDFEKNVRPLVTFLHEFGVPINEIGQFITKNPFIFKEDLENLEARINYLFSKKFTKDMILRIITLNPFWLNFSIERIDKRLGFFQQSFSLNGNEVRTLATKCPKLITYNLSQIKANTFAIKEEMGFDKNEVKSLLLSKPKIFMKDQNTVLKTFEFVHKTLGISHDMILKVPEILTFREFKLKERHMFLEKLGKAQYNPNKPNYVALVSLAGGSDADFCDKIAKTSVQSFNIFLKTL